MGGTGESRKVSQAQEQGGGLLLDLLASYFMFMRRSSRLSVVETGAVKTQMAVGSLRNTVQANSRKIKTIERKLHRAPLVFCFVTIHIGCCLNLVRTLPVCGCDVGGFVETCKSLSKLARTERSWRLPGFVHNLFGKLAWYSSCIFHQIL